MAYLNIGDRFKCTRLNMSSVSKAGGGGFFKSILERGRTGSKAPAPCDVAESVEIKRKSQTAL